MDGLGHELLLLMLNLSRLRDREHILRLFVEALSEAVPGVGVRRLSPGEEEGAGEVVEVATPDAQFGRIRLEDPAGLLSERDHGLFRNAIRMLAVVLENVSRAERLATENARLDAAVAERTSELGRLASELEARVAARTLLLTTANRELDAFAYSVSHDLRAPLRHIDGYVALLGQHLGPALDAQARRHMETVSAEVQRMGSLIDDLLAFSRMSRTRLAVRPVELGPLVREVVADLGADVAGRDVRWSIGELPAVLGDRALLRVVFVNLLGNALKFTRARPRAEIEVDCRPPEGADGALVRVRDNGVGFDPRYADRLFGVFERLHRAEDFEGTGIGLATVRRIVERHGGRAWAESVPGEGATFCLWLPARPPEGADAEPVETPRPG